VGALLAVPFASVFVAIFRFLLRRLAELDERATAIRAGAEEPPPDPVPSGAAIRKEPS
jgi:putative heme transporter